jgi:hypothetical protein
MSETRMKRLVRKRNIEEGERKEWDRRNEKE